MVPQNLNDESGKIAELTHNNEEMAIWAKEIIWSLEYKTSRYKNRNIKNDLERTYVEIILHIEIEGNKKMRKIGAYNN